jgi:hypothetical protein
MLEELVITLDESDRQPRFRVRATTGDSVSLFEVRVTESGSDDLMWRVVQKDSILSESVSAHLLTYAEADVEQPFDITAELARQSAGYGVPVDRVTYGQTPDGMRPVGDVRPLVPGRLYQFLAFGPAVGILEFYA